MTSQVHIFKFGLEMYDAAVLRIGHLAAGGRFIMFCALELLGLVIAVVAAVIAMSQAKERRASKMLADLHGAAPTRRASEEYHDQVWLPMCKLIEEHAVRLGRSLTG